MKKIIYISVIFIFFYYNLFSLIEKNDFNDPGLNEKNGTYGFASYLRKSYLMFFTGVGSQQKFDEDTGQYITYSEVGGRIHLYSELPEMKGFFFNGDMYISRNSHAIYSSGDKSWWNSFIPYFGETHFGYKTKFFTIKLGFQNLVSSDAIYNHLLIDDYSGSLFGLSIDSMLGRFVDIQLTYNMVRPHQSPWYSGKDPIEVNEEYQDDDTLYDVYYGKSLYTHKINFRPLPWIRIGVYEGVYFLGENLNPWYANPFFIYIGSQLLDSVIADKEGSRFNTHTANLLSGIDFNIGFKGWRVYGEIFIDDFNLGEYIKFKNESHPNKIGLIFGGELRGYIFTRNFKLSPIADFILSNLYINFEYGVVSKYTYSRDSNFNYEYVRDEYTKRYGDAPPSESKIEEVNRIGNFLGFMYGPNSDCIDFAIGWRSDLYNVKEYSADYQADVYFQSFKKIIIPKRLFKIQLHFRNYRLGDERDVIMPYYWNEHPSYDLETGDEKDEFGTSRKTEFLSRVVEIGEILDLNIYSDIVKLSRFVLGLESKFLFKWQTFDPFTSSQHTDFIFRWEFGAILSW